MLYNLIKMMAAVLLGCIGTAVAASSDTAFIVNGEPVSQSSLALLVEAQRNKGVADDAELSQRMRDEMVTRMVLAQQARSKHLDVTEAVKAQINVNELAVLSQAYLRDFVDGIKVSDKDAKKAYKKFIELSDAKEYKVRQILVANEVTAKQMIAQLENGADFVKLAKENSIDPGADSRGGDIGWFRPELFVDQRFSQAVVSLKKGEYTHESVQTKFGWHVIKLDDGPRKVKQPTYEELSAAWKKKVEEQVIAERVEVQIKMLIEQASVQDAADKRVSLK